jgi:hypothetical protein
VLAEEQPELSRSSRVLKGVSQEVALYQLWPQVVAVAATAADVS